MARTTVRDPDHWNSRRRCGVVPGCREDRPALGAAPHTLIDMSDSTIYIIDRIVLEPGRARAFIDAYLDEYAPGARERGLTLERVLVSPPAWIDSEPNTLTITWTVDGPREWWAAAVKGRHDPGPAQWWDSVSPMIIERTRSMAAAADAVEGLCDV